MQEVFKKIIEKLTLKLIAEKNIWNHIDDEQSFGSMKAYDNAIEIVKKEAEKYVSDNNVGNNGWIPADEPPKDDNYVLLSFENYSLPLVGRYQEDAEGGGSYYIGDCSEEDTCIANKLFVNAWQPLPDQYHPKGEYHERKTTNADQIRSMSDKELAEFLERFGSFNHPCSINKGEPLKWLQSEVEE